MKPAPLCCAAVLLLGSTASVAHAAEPSAEAKISASSNDQGTAETEATDGDPWLKRWAPERNMGEVGIYGGVLLPSRRIELFEADFGLPDQGYKPLARVLPDLGLRLGYFPLPLFGVEVEGGILPGRTEAGDGALLWTGRGHLVGQLGWWSVTPFVLAGGGLLGVSSDRTSLGDDVDASMHFGGGVKIYLNRLLQIRLDVRDIIAARRGYNAGVVHNPEILLGLSMTLGRSEAEPAPPPVSDSDGDGILDPDDRCKDEPGVADFDGCPIPDSDGDGILDADDQCKDEPGSPDFDGCPIPDSDGDGVLDPDDECKDEPGSPDYAGCPIPDSDGDGILDPDDQCKGAAETVNGFEDEDGCPDQIPQELSSFTGVIAGIAFDTGKATIRSKSIPVLEQARGVLAKYPSIRVEISGHTDDRGSAEINTRLSSKRAEAVKQYMVDKGIDAARISTRGAGPDEPIASNKKKRGRAKNRRIEFKLLTQ